MTKKSIVLFYGLCIIIISFIVEIIYIQNTKNNTQDNIIKKQHFVHIVQLPDLAICTEATYIRHRSLSTIFNIYKDDGVLREYFPSTFVYSANNNYAKN